MSDAPAPERGVATFLDALASRDPVPGGGAAAALAGALGAALVSMLAGLPHAVGDTGRLATIRARAEALRARLFALIRIDCDRYAAVVDALRLPREDRARPDRLARALEDAALPPLEVAELCAEVGELGAEAVRLGNPHAITDGGGGALLAHAAALLAADSLRVNLKGLEPHPDLEARTAAALDRVRAALARTRAAVEGAR